MSDEVREAIKQCADIAHAAYVKTLDIIHHRANGTEWFSSGSAYTLGYCDGAGNVEIALRLLLEPEERTALAA